MTNIAIVGSRNFNNYNLLCNELKSYLFNITYEGNSNGNWSEVLYNRYDNITIISGGAKGADTLAEKFAKEFNFKTKIFKPDWQLYGKSAGFVRNQKIVDNCDLLFAFQINKSKGTQNSIDLAKKQNKEVYVIQSSEENNSGI